MSIKEILMPSTFDEAKIMLSNHKNCSIIAGGTDLILDIKKNKKSPEYLLNINNINDLSKIREFSHHVILGSTTTFTDLLKSQTISKNYKCLADCASLMGSPQIRNIATLGGNISNAAPAADIIPCLLALDAVFNIEGFNSKRLINSIDYFNDYNTKKLKKNEILKEIILEKQKGKSGFYKLGKRNSLQIARISAAVYIESNNNIISKLSVALGAVGKTPFRLNEIENLCIGKDLSYLFHENILSILENKVYESINGRKTMPFKKEAVKGVYKEAIKKALEVN